MAQEVEAREIVSEQPTDVTHPKMYEWAVYLLGAIAIIGLIGQVALSLYGKEVPESLGNITLAAVVGLVGLLAPRGK